MLEQVEVCLPAKLADMQLAFPAELADALDDSVRAVSLLDARYGRYLGALSGLLLRTESVASSKIELIEASVDDYARAVHGSRANSSATAMVAASSAVGSFISAVSSEGRIRLEQLLTAHSILMRDDGLESGHAGALRTVQNWIGGSDFSPRSADYVPPPPDAVPELMVDLLLFVGRTDVPTALQAAIAHAQFELIHPFTDGNGRIGRALINAVLRLRGATRNVVVPAASALVARRSEYFAAFGAFREGDAGPIATLMVNALSTAAEESMETAQRLREIHESWQSELALQRRARSAGAPVLLLEYLLVNPVVTAEQVYHFLGGAQSRTYAALDRLHQAGIIEPLTQRKRNQVWGARVMLDELTDLDTRIQTRFAAPDSSAR